MSMTNSFRAAWPAAIAIVVALVSSGCSTMAANSGLSLVDASGNHPTGFVSTHPSLVTSPADAEKCQPCHGGDLAGGIANVSCFNTACHHGAVVNWQSSTVHGPEAKKAPGSSGFSSCQVCHGIDFARALGSPPQNCFDCHGPPAPHPPGPWLAAGTVGTHTNTHQANAPVCALCHFNEPGAGNHPPVDPPAGSNPGCLNNTLCHGALAPHPLGSVWNFPDIGGASFHGASAKTDLRVCQECHGTPGTILFEGGVAPTRCSLCHDAAKAHPTDWQGERVINGATITHRTATNPLDPAGQCAICHRVNALGAGPAPGAPSCFSGEFTNADQVTRGCHAGGPGVAHAARFDNVTHYQATAASGCLTCHAETGTSTNPAAPLCTVCHTNAAVSPLTTKNCTSCHANPPAGAAYPNIEGAHAEHLGLNSAGTPINCETCHNRIGSLTTSHYSRANGRVRTLAGAGLVNFVGGAFLYTSQSGGAAAFSNTAVTCSNIRCHGGQATPNWQTGAINTLTNEGCRLCHDRGDQAPAQYNDLTNSPFTQHINHAFSRNFSCTTCHAVAALTPSSHFGELASSAFPAGAANLTIVSTLSWDPTPPIQKGSCTTPTQGCH